MKLTYIIILSLFTLNYVFCQDDLNKYMISEHNKLRKNVDPPAKDPIPDLKYEDALAKTAKHLLDISNCKFGHSKPDERLQKYKDLGGTESSVGENIAWAGNKEIAMKLWGEDEKPFYDYESNQCKGGVCGHYTQIIWAKTTKIGCAQRSCSGKLLIFCNYAPAGNFIGQRPYEADPSKSPNEKSSSMSLLDFKFTQIILLGIILILSII